MRSHLKQVIWLKKSGNSERLDSHWVAKNLKFQMSIFSFFHFLAIKAVEICRRHASELGESLKWVELDDIRENWWK